MSDIYQILKQENYPFEGDIDSSVKKEIFIKADTFYCDKMVSNCCFIKTLLHEIETTLGFQVLKSSK